MDRRSFVQQLGVGAVGTLALSSKAFGLPASAATMARLPQQAALGTATDLIRIGSNENPYGPGTSAIEAVRNVAMGANRYPGPVTEQLIEIIAARHAVPANHVLLSGGSGDVLRAVVNAFTTQTAGIVTGSPSYESPMRQAQSIGAPVRAIPLKADMRLNVAAMARAGATATGLVYICNPNNPSSTAVPGAEISELIAKVARGNTHVLVDEAYFEYSDLPGFDTAVPHVRRNPNVIVARTFSKIHGMAGMRVGYAIAQPATLTAMRGEHSASGLSVMSLAAATASLLDSGHIEKQASLNREVRRGVMDAFVTAGFEVAPSDANFVFVNVRRDSRGFQEALRAKAVAVGRAFPPLTNWTRITIGTAEEMGRAMPLIMDVLASAPVPASASVATPSYDLTTQEVC